jgi:nucleoside 2-deoxyribosyltransferase
VDPTAFGGTSSIRHASSDHFDVEQEILDNDGFEVMLPTDGRLGLTNVEDTPADDWAADTGETRTAEGSEP